MASFEEEATQLLKAGWQQCSTFYPNDKIGGDLGLPEGAILLVLTQACSVVSAPLKRDPVVELIVATRLAKFNSKAPEARGGNARKFHVQLDDGSTQVPYELDIYQRHFAPREALLDIKADGPKCSDENATRVATWVGRFYTRTAFPNLLVDRLRAADFQKTLESALSGGFEGEETVHEQVRVIYGRWHPNEEEGPYELELHIAVTSLEAVDHLLEVLQKSFNLPNPEIEIEIDGVKIMIEVHEISTVTLESFEDMRRISDWDLLSGLKEEV